MSSEQDSAGGTEILRSEGRAIAVRRHKYRLRVGDGAGAVDRIVDAARLRVGSQEGNDLVLADPAVSRIHFEVLVDEQGYRLTDLGSTNGTRVDGYRVGSIYLRDGSEISVGQTTLRFDSLEETTDTPLSESNRFHGLVGRSVPMRELFARLERVAATPYPVLVEGETGGGKELVAEALHAASPRAGGPFVVFDCAAVSPSLLESALFGHERGAFTGAAQRRHGYLESAHGGTLFLDELGELPLELQSKLLRALDKGELRRVGGTEQVRFDARVVAATNRDLAEEVNRGAFRSDLYYRLAVIHIHVPPLRHRPEDIPLLVEHFLRRALGEDEAAVRASLDALGADGWRRLERHPWPGNVRELRNAVHRMLAVSEGPLAAPAAVPLSGGEEGEPGVEGDIDFERGFVEQRDALLERFERRYLFGLLERHDGNYSAAARAAGIDRMYFRRLVRKYE